MKTLLIDGLKMTVCSGVLLAAYRLLLERRAPLHWCRRYLLALPAMACIIPLLRIPLLPAPVIEALPLEPLPLAGPMPAAMPAPVFPWAETALLTLWLAGTLVLFAAMLRQLAMIRRLHRRARFSVVDGCRLALLPRRIAPFSFLHTIYLWEDTPAEECRVIIAHETSHIVHRHSAERIVMECMKALLWWNPFVWTAARRLLEAQEYEADRDVLAGGCDREHYMQTIFRQLFGYSPDIANGLRNSLTKKRFQMMTTSTGGRYVLLRLAGTALAVTGLLCIFSLTARAAQIRTAPDSAGPLYIVNGEQKDSQEEAFDFGKMLADQKKGTGVNLRRLSPEEATEKYGEKGSHGAVEITVFTLDEADAPATVPEVTVARFGEAGRTYATETAAPTTGSADADEPWLMAETMPRFQGGDLLAFRAWVQQRLRYPDTEATGRVVATFVVERDGSMGPIDILQTPDEALADEARRVLRSVPADSWTPGFQQGEAVRVRYTLPVDFRIIPTENSDNAE